jgi:hypothetical protein
VGAQIETAHIDPGKRWQNATDETFNGRLHYEYLSLNWFHERVDAEMAGAGGPHHNEVSAFEFRVVDQILVFSLQFPTDRQPPSPAEALSTCGVDKVGADPLDDYECAAGSVDSAVEWDIPAIKWFAVHARPP